MPGGTNGKTRNSERQFTSDKIPELRDVPSVYDMLKSDDDRKVFDLILAAQRLKIDLQALSGAEIESILQRAYATPATIIGRAAQLTQAAER
jgi:hypothetical protein